MLYAAAGNQVTFGHSSRISEIWSRYKMEIVIAAIIIILIVVICVLIGTLAGKKICKIFELIEKNMH